MQIDQEETKILMVSPWKRFLSSDILTLLLVSEDGKAIKELHSMIPGTTNTISQSKSFIFNKWEILVGNLEVNQGLESCEKRALDRFVA